MAVVQDVYRSEPGRGYPGMVANGETSNRISRTCEDAGGIRFGAACFRGAGDHGCTAVPAAGDFLGVAMADIGVQPLPGGVAADIYPQRASVGIFPRGNIWVTVGANVNDGEPAYVTPAGVWTNVAAGNVQAITESGVAFVFDETVANGGVCRLATR